MTFPLTQFDDLPDDGIPDCCTQCGDDLPPLEVGFPSLEEAGTQVCPCHSNAAFCSKECLADHLGQTGFRFVGAA